MRFFKILLYALLMGIGTTWVLILARPGVLGLGFSEHAADKLPKVGFFVGIGLGVALALSPSLKRFFGALLGALVLGAVLWFFGVLLEALLVGCGVSEYYVSWISSAAFCGGVILGVIPLVVISKEKLDTKLGRFRRRGLRG